MSFLVYDISVSVKVESWDGESEGISFLVDVVAGSEAGDVEVSDEKNLL